VLWFDTEDYVDSIADDAALRIANDPSAMGVHATFKVVGEKARVLQQRGRTDVIEALARHCIGYHSDLHSIQPVPALNLEHLGWLGINNQPVWYGGFAAPLCDADSPSGDLSAADILLELLKIPANYVDGPTFPARLREPIQ